MASGTYEFGPRHSVMAYGGSSVDIENRWGQHRRMLRRDWHFNPHLQAAWNKYGEGVFEFRILEIIEDAGERLAAEQRWLGRRHTAGTCYNIALDALAPFLGRTHTDATKQTLSNALTGNKNSLGSTHTDEWKRAASERQMGNQHCLGYKHTEEFGQAISERERGELNSNSKLVAGEVLQIRSDYCTGAITQCELATQYGVCQGLISNIVRGKAWAHIEGPTRHSQSRPNCKLTSAKVKNIRRLYSVGNITYDELGECYGVCRMTIGRIIRNETWKGI